MLTLHQDARTIEYIPQDGDRLRRILSTSRKDLAENIGDFHPKEVPNGNYMLEVCRSRDGQFVALLLQQFMQMSYEPVTGTLFFVGADAQIISQLFFNTTDNDYFFSEPLGSATFLCQHIPLSVLST